MGELGISSLKKVYDMTFAEFQIRLFAYKRMQVKEWEKTRLIAYCALIGAHQDVKKLPKNINSFMELEGDKVRSRGVSEDAKNRFLDAYKDYLKKVQHG